MKGRLESMSEHLPDEAQMPGSEQISSFTLFMKVGIIVLSIIAIIGFGIQILPNSVAVSTLNNKKDLPIYSVATDEKKVALSFDVSWGNDDIADILDILAKYNVRATFFLTGEWIEEYPEDVKSIALAGHDLGNHSENHHQMSQLSKEECIEEIMDVHDKIKELTGIDMDLFRAPYGDYNDTLLETATDCGYYTIQWSIDSEDWKDYSEDIIARTVLNNNALTNGSIILMHNGAKNAPEALDDIIIGLHKKGYQIVPVSQLIIQGEYTVDHTGRQFVK